MREEKWKRRLELAKTAAEEGFTSILLVNKYSLGAACVSTMVRVRGPQITPWFYTPTTTTSILSEISCGKKEIN